MAAGVRPPTLHADVPLQEIARSPLRLLTAAEPWQVDGPRRAGVSAFGFGGNNAHLILEESGDLGLARACVCVARPASSEDTSAAIAIVGMGAVVADGEDASDFSRDLFLRRSRVRERPGTPAAGFAEWVELEATGLRFPPRDLERTLPQQILALKAAREAVAEAGELPRESTAVLMGMQCDAEIARYGARWRVAQWARDRGHTEGWTDRAREAFCAPLEAPGVVGSMPNIVTNRLNSQFDLAGPSLSVSSEELSGIVALELAARALREREIDAALVGAVDVCAEPVHEHAARRALGPERQPAGDAAVVLVLKRLDDARRDESRVYGVLPAAQPERAELTFGDGPNALSLGPLFGHAHAASGLLHVAAAVLACRHAARLPDAASEPATPWLPSPAGRVARVSVAALGEQARELRLAGYGSGAPLLLGPVPRLHVFSGTDRADVRRRLEDRSESREGPCRLALVGVGEEEIEERLRRAHRFLAEGEPPGEGVYFREQPLAGELGFVFTGPAGAYRGMGSELLLGLPQLGERLFERFRRLSEAAGWIYAGPAGEPTPADKLWGSSFLCQIHSELTRGVMGLSPTAAIGFCSGETNALFALDAWQDIDDLYEQIEQAEIYSRELAGGLALLTRAWGRAAGDPPRWTNWRLMAPLERVRSAIAGEERVHVTTINAPGDVVIGGEADACERVVRRVGSERARRLGYDIVVHCPEMELFSETWRRIHHRPTFPVPGVRFYTHATGSHYQPTAETAADALVGQAVRTVDFPSLIENAWRDGVRVFVEHGPLGGCSRWIERTLGEREHLAVPLDLAGRSSLEQVVHAAAQLIVAGVDGRRGGAGARPGLERSADATGAEARRPAAALSRPPAVAAAAGARAAGERRSPAGRERSSCRRRPCCHRSWARSRRLPRDRPSRHTVRRRKDA